MDALYAGNDAQSLEILKYAEGGGGGGEWPLINVIHFIILLFNFATIYALTLIDL